MIVSDKIMAADIFFIYSTSKFERGNNACVFTFII